MSIRRRLAALLIAVLAAPLLAVPVPPATADPGPAQFTSEPALPVTLITGDRLLFHPPSQVEIDPAPRADGAAVLFTTLTSPEGFFVIPSDARPHLAAGRLDRGLFNVTSLVRHRFDDAHRPDLPLILSYPDGSQNASALPAVSGVRALPVLRGAAVRVDRAGTRDFWESFTRTNAKAWLDRPVWTTLDQSVPQIGAPQAWQAGFDGNGVTVAVLDTGVDPTHPDLTGKVADTANFTDDESAVDGHGHGTHVSSIIAGSGTASTGRYKGAAPGATLKIGKVLTNEGFGFESWIIAGMQWAAEGGAKVVSMSLGGGASDGTDPMSQAVDTLSAQTGALFVIAAGNDGGPLTVNTPGAATSALTVGSVDKGDKLSFFSSKGPRLGDAAVKPDILAPGQEIAAARAAGTSMGTPVDDNYTRASGTSMATPHVAGAAAIVAQAHPDWRGDMIKDALVTSAKGLGLRYFEQGAGRVDVPRALGHGVHGTAVIDFGRLPNGGKAVGKPVTYRNTTDRPVTLNLEAESSGFGGKPDRVDSGPEKSGPTPTSAVRLSTPTVTVPPGETSTMDVTVDPRAASVGAHGGTIVARSHDIELRSTLSFYREPELVELTVRAIGPDGAPIREGFANVLDTAFADASPDDPFDQPFYDVSIVDGVGTTLVRKGGSYSALASRWTHTLHASRIDLLSTDRDVRADRPVELLLDARRGVPVRVHSPQPTDTWLQQVDVTRDGARSAARMSIGGVSVAGSADIRVTPSERPKIGHIGFGQRWTLSPRALTMVGGGRLLHPRYLTFPVVDKLAGVRALPVVFAGQGRDEDFAGVDVKEKLALVRIQVPADHPDPTDYVLQQTFQTTQAAGKAGAAAIGLYVDSAGARAPVGLSRSPATPQLALSHDEGELLRRAGTAVRLHVRADLKTVYNLFFYRDRIPADNTHVVDERSLVRVPNQYHGDKRGLVYTRSTFAFGPHSTFAVNDVVQFRGPAEWTELVGPGDSAVRWIRVVGQRDDAGMFMTLYSWDRFRSGERARQTEHWYKAPLLDGTPQPADPAAPALACALCRGWPDADGFVPNWFLTDATPRHFVTAWPVLRSTVRMWQGDREIKPGGGPFSIPSFRLDPGPATYRLEADGPVAVNPRLRPVPQQTRTVWTFRSQRRSGEPPAGRPCPFGQGNACTYEPLLQVRYDLDLDLDNRAPRGPYAFTVAVAAHPGAIGVGRVAELSLSYSTDGGTGWTPAAVRRIADGRYRVQVSHPGSGSEVWLRVQAADDAGNRVDQTVRHAYGLR